MSDALIDMIKKKIGYTETRPKACRTCFATRRDVSGIYGVSNASQPLLCTIVETSLGLTFEVSPDGQCEKWRGSKA